MLSLKSQSEQSIFILTTKFENSTQLNELSQGIRKYLYENKSFPILVHDVKSIPKIANTEGTISKILKKIQFPIDYNKDFIKKEILSNTNIIQKAYDYISILILHFYLSFFRTNIHEIDDVTTLLNSLLLIISNKDINDKYQIYAFSGFTTIILDKQLNIEYYNTAFLHCMSDFFNLPAIPQESLLVLGYMVEKIGNCTEKEQELGNVLQVINFAFQKYKGLFSKKLINDILLNLRFRFVNMCYIALSFLVKLSEYANDQDLEIYIKAFPAALIPYYEKSIKKSNDEKMKIVVDFENAYRPDNNQSIQLIIPKSSKDKVPILNQNIFELKSLDCQLFNVLLAIAKSKNRKFCNSFVEQILTTIQLEGVIRYYGLVAIYIHLLIQLSPLSPELLEQAAFLFNDKYFTDPVFINDENPDSRQSYYLDEYVSSIRLLIINLLIRQDFEFIQNIFNKNLQRRSIFPEFCYRFIYVNDECKRCDLSTLLFEMYSINENNNFDEGKIACILTVKHYFNSQELRKSFFDNVNMYKYAFSFINRNQTRREFILDFLVQYFITCRKDTNPEFIDKLIQMLNIIADDCYNDMSDANLCLILDIIKFCTTIFQVNVSLIEQFESFFSKICLIVKALPTDNKLSKQIFSQAFSMFSCHNLTLNESIAIETSAISLFGLTPELKKSIILLMSADSPNQDEFIIRQPKAVVLLCRLFKDDNSIFPFLSNLCNYSPINSALCHESGIDSLILEKLIQIKISNDLKNEKIPKEGVNPEEEEVKSEKEEKEVDKEAVNSMVTLFFDIAKNSSSINIVNRYMSLLCSDPVNNRLSDYHMMFIELLNKLAKYAQHVPMTAYFEPQKFCNINIVFDWTVCVWIFMTDFASCSFINVSSGDSNYEVSIKNMSFVLVINHGSTEYQLNCKIPLYKWVCVTLKVEPQNTTLLLNDEEQCTVSHQSFFINSANILFNSSKTLCLGGMTVYNSIINENLYEKGPRSVWKDPENSLVLAVRPYLHNNQIQSEVFPQTASTIQNQYKKSFSNMNFVDILCERCGITLILPLLAQVKMLNADPNLLLETLSIIRNLLQFRINSQIKFGEMDGIQILAHLLAKCYLQEGEKHDKEIITDRLNYEVYTKLFDIYKTLSLTKLKKKYLKYILVNLMIWVHSKQDDIVKIMHLLAAQDKNIFWTHYKLTYSLTIAAFRVYFSQSNYQNFPKFKGSDEDRAQIRQDLITFSRKFCNDSVLNSDFLIVLSHLKCSSDMKKETDLLDYLKEIIDTDNKNAKNIKPESKMMICYLMRKATKTIVLTSNEPPKSESVQHKLSKEISFVDPPNKDGQAEKHSLPVLQYEISIDFNLLVEIIELLYDSMSQYFTDKTSNFSITLENQTIIYVYQKDITYFIMRWICDLFIDEKLLDLLIPLINDKYPLLFPLGSMISVSLGNSYFYKYLHEIKFNPIINEIDDLWYMWVVVGIYEFNSTLNQSKNKVTDEASFIESIDFILNNAKPAQWGNIFNYVLSLSLYDQYHESSVAIMFLRLLSKRIDNQEKCGIFIKLAMNLLYFRKYENKLNKGPNNHPTYDVIFDVNDKSEVEEEEEHVHNVNKTSKLTTKTHPELDSKKANTLSFHSDNYPKHYLSHHRISNLAYKRSFLRYVSSSLSHLEHENNIEEINPKKNKKVSMKTIDDLNEIQLKSIFDLNCIQRNNSTEKIEEVNQNPSWFDIGLSNQIVDLFLSYPSVEYSDEVILIESYRIKYSSPNDRALNKPLIDALNALNLPESYSISYFNSICQKFQIESPFKQKINNSHLIDQYRKRKDSIIKDMNIAFENVQSSVKNVKKLFKYYIEDQIESTNVMFQQTIQDYLGSVFLRMTKSKNKWSHLWASMVTGTETPWHLSIKQQKIFYKRDFSSCFCFCPFKIKVNKKYDRHLVASYTRNTGSQKTAKELYNEYLEKRKKNEIHNYYGDINEADLNDEIPDTDHDISQYIFTADCQVIKVSKEIEACFKLSKDSIVIQMESKVKKYPLYSIEKILLRDHLHRPTAIEIFLYNGVTLFLNFTDVLNNVIIEQIAYQVISNGENFAEIQYDNSTEHYFRSKKITQMWCENKISNFEYLMLLNIYSGRSFNNASQYPFLPWIILDYDSKTINPNSLRPLSKPIGAVSEARLQRLLANYEEKKREDFEPFLYSSGPTCPLALYYWLVRVEPFTTFHISMQGGSFDHADRVFSSWNQASQLVLTMDDMYRELPPEAYFSHSFMINYNELSLGISNRKEDGNENTNNNASDPKSIENCDPSSQNVQLPPWSSNSLEFVYMSRKVLESEIVSRNLNNWIDLFWGYKQKGQEAEKAMNVYRPEMYHDIWSSQFGSDENNWPVIEAYLSQVGQIPIQLFTEPHPKKNIVNLPKLSSNESIPEIKSFSSIDIESSDPVKTNVKISVEEVKSFFGAQIVTKRTSVSEAQSSFNYDLMKNKINIFGINDDGEVTIIKIGYTLAKESEATPKSKKSVRLIPHRNSKQKMEKSQVMEPYVTDISNVSYNTSEIEKKTYSLTSNIKRKRDSSLTKKFRVNFNFLDDTKIVYSDNVQNVLLYDDFNKKEEAELLMNQNKITALAFDGELNIASIDSDGFLSVLQIFRLTPADDEVDTHKEMFSLEVLFTIPSFHENIYCCDISKSFHQVVCGSFDGFILIFSLSNQTLLKTINLDEGKRPQFVKITPSWGFIFAVLTEISENKTKTYLAVWTINGDFIRMKEIDSEITNVTTWRSKSGFDYFLLSTPRSKIYAGEVFTLDIFFNSYVNDEIISLGYDYDLENAIVISKDGLITFFPCSAPPSEF